MQPRSARSTDAAAPEAELAERIARLTPGQRLCLSLVAKHLSSKEIAKRLGISPHTVDQRIRLALRTLKVSNRKEAALLLLRQETDRPRRARIPWPTRAAPKNDMAIGWRLTWIAVIAIASAFAAGLALAASESFLSILRGSGH